MKPKKPLFKVGDIVHPNFIEGSKNDDYPCCFVDSMTKYDCIVITGIEPITYDYSKYRFAELCDGFAYTSNDAWIWSTPMFLECQEI